MPNGDARFKIKGQLVFLKEQRIGINEPRRILTRAEAEQLRDELNAALRAFDVAKYFAREIVGPTAALLEAKACRSPYPFRDHRTLQETGFGDTSEAASAASARPDAVGDRPVTVDQGKFQAGYAWCEQCEKRVSTVAASRCSSRFCKLKAAA
jgi:hypothetical protein